MGFLTSNFNFTLETKEFIPFGLNQKDCSIEVKYVSKDISSFQNELIKHLQ